MFSHYPKLGSTEVPRWKSQDEGKKAVWNYFDGEVVPQIIKQALQKNVALSFSELYHVLSMVRLKCEYVKTQADTKEKMKELAQAPIPYGMCEFYYFEWPFGQFQVSGTREPNVTNGEIWGEDIAALSQTRIGSGQSRRIGLSTYESRGGVEGHVVIHPIATVLERLEQDFTRLINTTDLFEYFIISSRLVYELSNYPPIERGSSAVSAWVINNIFRNKFNCDFNIIPYLYDWYAYYEMAEQYTAYFVISCLSTYIKQKMPACYDENLDFFELLSSRLMLDPSLPENLAIREEVWAHLKSIIDKINLLDDPWFKDKNNWQLLFRKPSSPIIELFSKNINEDGQIEGIDYLNKLFALDEKLSEEHVKAFGDPEKEDQLAMLWVDLEVLRNLSEDKIKLIKVKTGFTQDATGQTPVKRSRNFYFRIGHGIPEDNKKLKEVDPDWKNDHLSEDSHCRELRTAIINGGMKLSDLSHLDKKQIRILTSEAAMLLYTSNNCIRITDIVASTAEETANNILQLIAKYITKEEYIEIKNKGNIFPLLSPECLNLYKEGKCKISDLVSEDRNTLNLNIINSYLTCYSNEKDILPYFEKLTNEKIDECVNLLWFLSEEAGGKNDFTKFLEKFPHKLSILIQLDFKELYNLNKFYVKKDQIFVHGEIKKIKEKCDEIAEKTYRGNIRPTQQI